MAKIILFNADVVTMDEAMPSAQAVLVEEGNIVKVGTNEEILALKDDETLVRDLEGKILMPNNISNLIAQNAYVFILATGMLLCILTGGNIDLAVGSVVCFSGAVGAVMLAAGYNLWIAVAAMLVIGLVGAVIGLF